MNDNDIERLTRYAKNFAGLTPAREQLLKSLGPLIEPSLPAVTEVFYNNLAAIPEAAVFLEGRLDMLKQTHLRWLKSLFSGAYGIEYTAAMQRVGDVHVKVNLPVEFMAGGTTALGERLVAEVDALYRNEPEQRVEALQAVNAILGFSLIIMQQSFQNSSLHQELEKFLRITGMSRALFNNLAAAYR